MTTPMFSIKKIDVHGNDQIEKETIESLSELEKGVNIFQFNKYKVESNIKQNPYMETVLVKRKLPGTVNITVKERYTKYVIEYGNGYIYLNSQGYILEISDTKPEVPVIRGLITKTEDMTLGSRVEQNDLEKLDIVIKIMEAANSNEIGSYITMIDMTKKNDYTIFMEGQLKTIYLGEATNLNDRMLTLKEILQKEAGKKAEIFLNRKDNVYVRESIE